MLHIPCFWWVKIGITGKSTRRRAASINREMWGIPVPIIGIPIPFAAHFEAMLHRHCKPLNVRFYKGSGFSEWFWFPAAIPALLVMLFWVVVYAAGILALAYVLKG